MTGVAIYSRTAVAAGLLLVLSTAARGQVEIVGKWMNVNHGIVNEFFSDQTVSAPAVLDAGYRRGTWQRNSDGSFGLLFASGHLIRLTVKDRNTLVQTDSNGEWKRIVGTAPNVLGTCDEIYKKGYSEGYAAGAASCVQPPPESETSSLKERRRRYEDAYRIWDLSRKALYAVPEEELQSPRYKALFAAWDAAYVEYAWAKTFYHTGSQGSRREDGLDIAAWDEQGKIRCQAHLETRQRVVKLELRERELRTRSDLTLELQSIRSQLQTAKRTHAEKKAAWELILEGDIE